MFRVGGESHRNNVQLGRFGRNRSNLWSYAGANTFAPGRMDALSAHPTVKPIALVADAILDCTARGDLVLDQFAGSGTILLAAEKTGRIAHAMEYGPRYVDVAIRRWESVTKLEAALVGDGRTFEEIAASRLPPSTPPAPQSPHVDASDRRKRTNRERGHASRKTSASSKSDVGYRRPPKATQFKKETSGNPRGRPKGSRDIGNVLLDVTRQKIPVTENGRTRRMPALEVMLREFTNEAIQNDQGALKLLFTLMERYADIPKRQSCRKETKSSPRIKKS